MIEMDIWQFILITHLTICTLGMFFGFCVISYCSALCVARADSFLAATILGFATRSMEVMRVCRSTVQFSFRVKSTISHLIMLFPCVGASSILLWFCSPWPALLLFQGLEWVSSSHKQVMASALFGEARVSILFSSLRIFLPLKLSVDMRFFFLSP